MGFTWAQKRALVGGGVSQAPCVVPEGCHREYGIMRSFSAPKKEMRCCGVRVGPCKAVREDKMS